MPYPTTSYTQQHTAPAAANPGDWKPRRDVWNSISNLVWPINALDLSIETYGPGTVWTAGPSNATTYTQSP